MFGTVPLLATLIASGADRSQAVARLGEALERYHIEGVRTTRPLHRRLVASPGFRAGSVHHTQCLERGF